jgi:hypothetical protein
VITELDKLMGELTSRYQDLSSGEHSDRQAQDGANQLKSGSNQINNLM